MSDKFPTAKHLLSMREEYESVPSLDERQWEYFQSTPHSAVILPSNRPSLLFRGQNCHYSPSYSSLSRGLPLGQTKLSELTLESQARILDRITRRLWFIQEMEHHPATKWLESQRLRGFDMALAQHYGIPTGYMDLSESFDVSCFFATCQYTNGAGWQPCASGGIGVMYCLPIDRIPIRPDVLQPIGLQVFPRPREQWGWVVVTGIGVDFESLPGLQIFEFEHDREVSEYFLEKFERGTALFPDDAMAEVAEAIMKSLALPEELLATAANDLCHADDGFSSSPQEVISTLKTNFGVASCPCPPILKDELLPMLEKQWNSRTVPLANRIGFSLVRKRPSS